MDLQGQLEVGKQAEDFLRYINEQPYFRSLIDRIKLEYAQSILSLSHDDKDKFVVLKSRMDAFGDIENAVIGDIRVGENAFLELDGKKPPDMGIL